MSVIFWKIGMMDCWNSGIMGIKTETTDFLFFFFLPHHSRIPLFQYPSWDVPAGAKALSSHIINGLQKYTI
jgi:hypothetical protein